MLLSYGCTVHAHGLVHSAGKIDEFPQSSAAQTHWQSTSIKAQERCPTSSNPENQDKLGETSEIISVQVENGHGDVLSFSLVNGEAQNVSLKRRDGEGEEKIGNINFSKICAIAAGASHFLVHTILPQAIYSIGVDNRFGQLGRKSAELCARVTFFDGLEIAQIACGNLHSAVVDTSGGCYLFGADAKRQCGGRSCGSEPTLIELPVENGDEQPDIIGAACGSVHTALLTADARVFVAGQSNCLEFLISLTPADHHRQLGFSDLEPRSDFVEQPLFKGATKIQCSRWATIAEVPEL